MSTSGAFVQRGYAPENVNADIEHRHEEANALEKVADEKHAKGTGFRRVHDPQDV